MKMNPFQKRIVEAAHPDKSAYDLAYELYVSVISVRRAQKKFGFPMKSVKPPAITEDKKISINSLANAQTTPTEIADKLGLDRKKVYTYLKENNLPFFNPRFKEPTEKDNKFFKWIDFDNNIL